MESTGCEMEPERENDEGGGGPMGENELGPLSPGGENCIWPPLAVVLSARVSSGDKDPREAMFVAGLASETLFCIASFLCSCDPGAV